MFNFGQYCNFSLNLPLPTLNWIFIDDFQSVDFLLIFNLIDTPECASANKIIFALEDHRGFAVHYYLRN